MRGRNRTINSPGEPPSEEELLRRAAEERRARVRPLAERDPVDRRKRRRPITLPSVSIQKSEDENVRD